MPSPPHLIRPDGGSHRCAGLQARDCLPAPDDDDPDQMTIISAPAAAAAVPTHPSFEVSANVSGAVLHVTRYSCYTAPGQADNEGTRKQYVYY